MTAVRVQGLSFAYDQAQVLHGVDMHLAQGEMLALLGPNGSGKTSLLRLLAGLEMPASGSVRFFNTDQLSYTHQERARCIGFMPQEEAVDLPFTVQKATLLGRAPWQGFLGSATADDLAQVEAALLCTGLVPLAHRPLAALSGGERQRAALARIICQSPQIYLLDEPTSAQDYGQQVQIMRLLTNLCRQGATVVLATHDVNLAAFYAHKVALLRQGRLLALGDPHSTLTQENLEFLYDCPMLVDVHPITHSPRVMPEP